MDMILTTFLILTVLAVVLKTYKPALYLAVGWLIEAMVRAAEQKYKETSGKIDRRKLAKEQIRTVLKFVGIDPDKWNDHIDWLIDAAITRLPKTPTFDEDPAASGVI